MGRLESWNDFKKVREDSEMSKELGAKEDIKDLIIKSKDAKEQSIIHKKQFEDEKDDSKKETHLLQYKMYRAEAEMLDAKAKLLKKGIKGNG